MQGLKDGRMLSNMPHQFHNKSIGVANFTHRHKKKYLNIRMRVRKLFATERLLNVFVRAVRNGVGASLKGKNVLPEEIPFRVSPISEAIRGRFILGVRNNNYDALVFTILFKII